MRSLGVGWGFYLKFGVKIYTPVHNSRYEESSFFPSSAESADEQDALKRLSTNEIEDLLKKDSEKKKDKKEKKNKPPELDSKHEGKKIIYNTF